MKKFLATLFLFALLVSKVDAPLVAEEFHMVASYDREDLLVKLPVDKEKFARSILSELPEDHSFALKKLIGESGEDARRGLASYKSIYLGLDKILTKNEFRRVLIHEMGHIVDLGVLKHSNTNKRSNYKDGSNTIYDSDLSLDFYKLCFDTETTQNGNCDSKDFVSEYAQVDVFEDFAESYLLFVENNKTFQKMAENSEILSQKYDFFKNIVFANQFKNTEELKNVSSEDRVWDLTKAS